MQVYTNVKRFYSSLQDRVPFRRHKDLKRQLVISQPFDFKKEASILPGFTEDEISVLREKAAASRLGVADNLHAIASSSRDPSPNPSRDYMHSVHPCTAPAIPMRAARRHSGSVISTCSPPGMTVGGLTTRQMYPYPMSSSLPASADMTPSMGSGSGTPASMSMPVDLDFCLGSLLSPLPPGAVPVLGRSGRSTRPGRSRSA